MVQRTPSIQEAGYLEGTGTHSPTVQTAATLLKAVIAVLAWGASFIATKIALREMPPGGIIWLRFGIGTLVLAVFLFSRRERARIPLRTFVAFALLGFFGVTFHQWLQVNGLVTAQAATSAWIVTTVPVFIAILGRFALKETLGLFRTAGIFIAACGVLLVVSHGDLRALVLGHAGTRGDFLVLLSAITWAVFSVVSRRVLQRQSATVAMLYVMGSGWLFSTFLLPRSLGDNIMRASAGTWLSVGFLGVLCSGIAFVFWYDALKALPAARVGALLYLEPLVAVGVAAALLNEPLLPATLLGGMLILGGVWMVNRN